MIRIYNLLFIFGIIYGITAAITDWSKVIVSEPHIEYVTNFPDEENQTIGIFGGKQAKRIQFPYQVGLKLTVLPNTIATWCGGSLIGKNWVLTSAHCLYSNKFEFLSNGSLIQYNYEYDWVHELVAYIGGYNLDKEERFQKIYVNSKSNFIIHNGYEPNTLRNDIGLVHLPEEAKLNEFAQVVNLPPDNIGNLENEMILTSGWGITNDKNRRMPKIIQFIHLKVMPKTYCQSIYSLVIEDDKQICVNGRGKKSTCDSGGPNVYEMDDGKRVIVGVTSFGARNACKAGYPSILTRVSNYIDWIKETKEKFR